MDIERLKQILNDAGCSLNDIQRIADMCTDEKMDSAIKMIRKNRCALMDELHESGRKVDCLDFLIRNLEKEMKQAD